MSDDKTGKSAEGLRAEAQRLVLEIEQFWKQAEEQGKAAALSRQKADSEALFAFNAKGACEGHSTTIANLKGTAEADATSISSNKQRADELIAAVTTAASAVEADRKTTVDSRREVEQASSQSLESARKCDERLQQIEKSREAAETAQKEAKASSEGASEACGKAEAAEGNAQKSAEKADKLVSEIGDQQNAIARLQEEVKLTAATAKTDRENLKQILEHISKSDGIASANEARASEVSNQLTALLSKVESLLPGATSASLATAFNQQRARFKSSQRRWLLTFILCIVGLLLVSAPSFYKATFGDLSVYTWEAILRGLTARLPVAIPLVWLAIYAGRNYMLSLRMEEDYAYKEAISIAFEGYKREMSAITSDDGDNPTPLTTLCSNILKAIAERPGRIYDGKHLDITLLTEAQQAAKRVEELSQKPIATK